MEGHRLAVMVAVGLAELRVEGEGAVAETDSGVVLLQPRHPQDDIVGGGSHIEGQGFLMASGAEGKWVVLRDVAGSGFGPVGQSKGDRICFGAARKVAAFRKVIINEATLSSAV